MIVLMKVETNNILLFFRWPVKQLGLQGSLVLLILYSSQLLTA